ncbi:purine-nucleoside phosphorylase [Candidatus Haliotispira prima]|uniref:Uridine phosphorylase n=1 Tax=Candidatus Haliotispira prima TaxID=3034016 RepID=A0ABY8MMP5_9SPIO|nr:purine-nucleoside phosphorylase [Candidatus Haliotispira prima]
MNQKKLLVPTPHIDALQGDFAPTVLMPGDPLRAKFVAENFLEDVRQVTGVRNMLGFTGTYRGKSLSVMGSGMGMPSISIYAHELFSLYGVESIMRIGSTGGLQDRVQMNDVIIAMGASTCSNVNRHRFMGGDFAAIADYCLLETSVQKARELGIRHHVGNIVSGDLFYDPRGMELFRQYRKMNILGVEMEAAALYGVAAELGKRALCLLTVSDHIFTGESLDSEARQNSFTDMIKLSLETAIAV